MKNVQGQSQPTTTVNPIIDNTPIKPANPKTSNSKIPPVSKNPIPPLIIDQNNVINESMSYAFTVVKSKPKRAPGLTFNDEQNEHVKSAVKQNNKERDSKFPSHENTNIITLEQKNKLVSEELDRMSRTLGIRVGPLNMIEGTRTKLIQLKKWIAISV